MSVNSSNNQPSPAVEALIASYRSDSRAHRIDKRFLPSREEIVDIVDSILELLYPGYWGRTDIAAKELPRHIERSVASLRARLSRQIELCVLHREEVTGRGLEETMQWVQVAARIADAFIDALPGIRRILIGDVQAAFDGDPAAKSLDEVILAYPGVLAVSVYRIAHQLHVLGVPLMPRVMAEWAHARTGADLHPGATIGQSFFIDRVLRQICGSDSCVIDQMPA